MLNIVTLDTGNYFKINNAFFLTASLLTPSQHLLDLYIGSCTLKPKSRDKSFLTLTTFYKVHLPDFLWQPKDL